MLPPEVTERTNNIVAIFDDDEDILSICMYFLTEIGWTVQTYTDCNKILEKLAGKSPGVILMDNWIPDEGGIVATRALKASEEFRYIPVVYFSANADIRTLASAAGADAYLAKPFDLEALTAVLDRMVTGSGK